MTTMELGNILREMYSNANTGEKVTMIHLFGIKYGKIIKKNRLRTTEIIAASGINKSYKTEVSKGIKLAKYVRPI